MTSKAGELRVWMDDKGESGEEKGKVAGEMNDFE